MIYKFSREMATEYSCYVEADSLEEAKEKVDKCEFYDDNGWFEDENGETIEVEYHIRVGMSVEDIEEGEYDTVEEWNAYSRD